MTGIHLQWFVRSRRGAGIVLMFCIGSLLGACGSGSDPLVETAEVTIVSQAVSFETSDGAQLYAVVTGADELRARPLIIEFSPYGGTRTPDFGPAYNHVYVQARGTGQSTGVWTAVGPNDQRDVAEFVEWACHQPWSNGRIGLYGFSASAIAVYNAMHLPLPCVEAAALMAGTADLYRDLLYPGGAMNLLPGAAVAFGVGIPVLSTGLVNLLTTAASPIPAVISDAGFLGTVLQVLAHVSEDEFWQERTQRPGPNTFPVLADTGFYDVESRGPFESYKLLRDQGVPVHLRVFGAHDGFPAGTPGPFPEYRRWFDRFLLGIDNGIDREAPVQFLLGHGSYEAQIAGAVTPMSASDWPVPGTHWQPLHLSSERGGGAWSLNDGTLALALAPVAAKAQQSYLALTSLPTATDPNTTAVIAAGGGNALFNALPILTELALMAPLSLTYTTAPLQQDVDVVGTPSLVLHLSTLLPEADIHAVLADVWPDGSAHAIGLGRLRSSYPEIIPERSLIDANGEIVQPYTDYSHKTYALSAQQREYHVEFWPIGNRFQAGHRLRLYLMGAPTYSLPSPNLNSISIGGDTPSRLLVPVLPGNDLCAALAGTC